MTDITPLIAVIVGVVGLLVGSFANVAIWRWPRGGSVREPARSHCPSCGEVIRGVDNIPVVSWLILRGRCRNCAASIAGRYPAVEAVTGLLFAAIVLVHGSANWALPALLVFAWAMVVATAIDLEHRIIPNKLTYPLAPILLVLVVLAAAVEGTWADLVRALIAGAGVPGVMLLLSEGFRLLRGKVGFGMGDIKLAASIGLVVGYLGGWELVIFAYGAMLTGVAVAIVLIVTGRVGLASKIPFGPYLAIGSLVAVLGGDPLATRLARLLGL